MRTRFQGLAPLTAACLLLLAAGLCAGCSGGAEETGPAEAAAEDGAASASGGEGTDQEGEGTAVTPLARKRVELYFPSEEEDGLVGEFHEIFDTVTPGDRVKQIVVDLISGPEQSGARHALPTQTRLRQAFVLDSGVAYLDFSGELKEIGGGSMREILAVYSIVNSVVINVPEIQRVGILINGRTVTTLNGHLDLRRPLPPDYSLILRSIIVEDRTR